MTQGSKGETEQTSMLHEFLAAVATPACVLHHAHDGTLRVATANAALAALIGQPAGSLDGQPASTILPPLLLRALTAHASRRAGTPVEAVVPLGPAARLHRVAVEPAPAAGTSGLIATFTNLGAGKAASAEPAALEILDLQSEMVSRWRPDGTIDYCNEAFARQCGRAKSTVVGANLRDLTPPAEMAQILANVARLTPKAPMAGYDHRLVDEDGTERWQEWIDRASFDAAGQVVGYLSVGRDITARKLAERRLAESEQRLKLALEAGRQGVWEASLERRRSGILLKVRGSEPPLDLGGSLNLYHADDREPLHRMLDELATGDRDSFQIELRRAVAGGWVWVQSTGRVVDREEAGGAVRLVGTTIDITDRKAAEAELRASEQRLRLALEAGSFGVWEQDLTSGRLRLDMGCLAQHGWVGRSDEVTLAEIRRRIHPADRAQVRATYDACRRGERAQARLAYRIRRPDGGYAWIEEHAIIGERGPDGRPVRLVGVSTDISARKEDEERLAHLALHDPLTGLPNRRALAEALDRAVAQAQRSGLALAVLALDLDGFKAINDRLGHPAGDAALLEICHRLRRTVRRSDVVARLGGDEFAVIAGELKGPQPVVRLARRIRSTLAEPLRLPAGKARTGVSIGVAFYPGDGDTPELLLSRADRALYAAKRDGVGCRLCAELQPAAPAAADPG